MKATSPSQYKQGKTKEVTLPSVGADGSHPVFTIRKLGIKPIIKLLDAFEVEIKQGSDVETLERELKETIKTVDLKTKIVQVIEILLPAGISEPKVTAEPAEDSLCLDDIEFNDQMKLFDEIWDFNGLGEKASEERKKFR